MAQKTLIGETAYEISGGKTLVNGTEYSIKKGKTLVGGTVYEVGFVEKATVALTGSGSVVSCYIQIDGRFYTSETTLSLPVGTTIYCVAAGSASLGKIGAIYLNGESVGVSTGMTSVEYDLTVKANTTIRFEYISTGAMSGYGYIYITET